MERIPFTKEGFERLKKELETLEKIERYKAIKAIELARAHGDLSENAEYHAAKERQGQIEARIQYLNSKLSSAEVIESENQDCDRVVFGVKVRLENIDSEEEVIYRLVGPEESDVQKGNISVTSPLGQALIGKYEGDDVEVRTPGGIRNYEILEIFV
jgi:transcription elongation factor GreA